MKRVSMIGRLILVFGKARRKKNEKLLFVILLVSILMICTIAHMEGPIVVMDDEIDLLTCEEVLSGVMLDPETLFAYKILPDGTVQIERYCWYHKQVEIPETIQGLRVSRLGDYLFIDVPTEDVFLPNTNIKMSDSTFDFFEGTVWMKANHPYLAFVVAIINKKTNTLEYYRSTETNEDTPKFRYYIEIEDYPTIR